MLGDWVIRRHFIHSAILKVLSQHKGQFFTITSMRHHIQEVMRIEQLYQINVNSLANALRTLASRGLIVKVDRGRYASKGSSPIRCNNGAMPTRRQLAVERAQMRQELKRRRFDEKVTTRAARKKQKADIARALLETRESIDKLKPLPLKTAQSVEDDIY